MLPSSEFLFPLLAIIATQINLIGYYAAIAQSLSEILIEKHTQPQYRKTVLKQMS